MLTTTNADGYALSTDPGRIDMDRVYSWLSTDTYWALGRPREVVERSFANSLPFGVYRPDGAQVAVARMVTDSATFAWLADVYVDREERGRGLATWMVRAACDEVAALGGYRILLATADAHGVYAKVGFTSLDDAHKWMVFGAQPR